MVTAHAEPGAKDGMPGRTGARPDHLSQLYLITRLLHCGKSDWILKSYFQRLQPNNSKEDVMRGSTSNNLSWKSRCYLCMSETSETSLAMTANTLWQVKTTAVLGPESDTPAPVSWVMKPDKADSFRPFPQPLNHDQFRCQSGDSNRVFLQFCPWFLPLC